ncbi:TPA: hypothetical protein N2C25_003914 [Pseudomonas aeruginosa]|nr:hypothetical protein [Pseudomonas aeruginosa]
MSKQSYTPGPWQWSNGRLLHNVPGEYSDTILDIQDKVWRPTEEDARLIAAAPDLLEALTEAADILWGLGQIGPSPTALEKSAEFKSLITKATA